MVTFDYSRFNPWTPEGVAFVCIELLDNLNMKEVLDISIFNEDKFINIFNDLYKEEMKAYIFNTKVIKPKDIHLFGTLVLCANNIHIPYIERNTRKVKFIVYSPGDYYINKMKKDSTCQNHLIMCKEDYDNNIRPLTGKLKASGIRTSYVPYTIVDLK